MQSILVRGGFAPQRGSLTILTYHRVLPSSSDELREIEPGMFVDAASFRMHLETLPKYFTPISIRDWLALSDKQARQDRFVAIAFDDGWRDNFLHAFGALRETEFPASIFLVVRGVEQGLRLWSEVIADLYFRDDLRPALLLAVQSVPVLADARRLLSVGEKASPEGLSRLISSFKALTDTEVADFLESLVLKVPEARRRIAVPPEPEFMSWAEVKAMAATGFIDFGSHTMSHARLDRVEDETVLQYEIVESGDILKRELGPAFNGIFCYPNGDRSARATELVMQSYDAACTTMQGANSLASSRYDLTRTNIHRDVSHTPASILARAW